MGTMVNMQQVFGIDLGGDYVNNALFTDEDEFEELDEQYGLTEAGLTIEIYGNEYWNHPVLAIGRSVKGSASEASPLKIDGIFLPTKHELAALEKVAKAIGVTFTPRNLIIATCQ